MNTMILTGKGYVVTTCYCSLGWVNAVFETILGKPVKVKLEQAIGRGDKVCKFTILLGHKFYD